MATINRLSKGNKKTGKAVVTYSRAPIATCPGASDACKAVCYALKSYTQYDETKAQWNNNASLNDAPRLKAPKRDGSRTMVRIHVSGDFDTAEYIDSWTAALALRPDVDAWAYTKSWRVAELLPALERLRALPNMQLFASVDASMPDADATPTGWRRAVMSDEDLGVMTPQCMEQTGKQADCASCGYCFKGKKGNIRFGLH